jgi:hypothetical protein
MTLRERGHFRPGSNTAMLGGVIAPVVILFMLVLLVSSETDE